MVREWCDKTTLVMNKLYPTIFGETFLLDDESVPWNTYDFTNLTTNENNSLITNDLSDKSKVTDLNETKATYKTCLSKKCPPEDLYISGIKPLEQTVHDCKDSSCLTVEVQSKRFSVFENFSLPGSPNSITHKNYNSKSSLKECKNRSNKLTPDHSLITEDDSVQVDLDKVMAVVQNRTNERLSSSSDNNPSTAVKALNTRRSSASSGVSSNFSGGSIAVANVEEEYKYEDKEESVVLIEKRLLVSTVV